MGVVKTLCPQCGWTGEGRSDCWETSEEVTLIVQVSGDSELS